MRPRPWFWLVLAGCGSTAEDSADSESTSAAPFDLPPPIACEGFGSPIDEIALDATTFVVYGQPRDTSLDAAIASVTHSPCMRATQATLELRVAFGPLAGVDTESLLLLTFTNMTGTVDLTVVDSAVQYLWKEDTVTHVFDFYDSPVQGTATVTEAPAPGDHFVVHLEGEVGAAPEESFDFTIDAVRP